MSGLVRWLATANPRLKVEWPAPTTDGLPNPNDKRGRAIDAAVCAAANAEIELSMADGQITSTVLVILGNTRLAISTTAKMAQYLENYIKYIRKFRWRLNLVILGMYRSYRNLIT